MLRLCCEQRPHLLEILPLLQPFDRHPVPPVVRLQLRVADTTSPFHATSQRGAPSGRRLRNGVEWSAPAYLDMAVKFVEHFRWIASSMINAGDDVGMWDEEDTFFYDVLRLPDGRALAPEGPIHGRPALLRSRPSRRLRRSSHSPTSDSDTNSRGRSQRNARS